MPKEISPPRRLACLGFGLLAGMAAGAAELFWRLEASGGELLAYALFWYGLIGAAYFGLAGEISRLAIQRAWYSASYSARPPLAGGLVALGLPVLALFQFVQLFESQLPTTRLILFFIILAASGLAGWCVSRALAARPGFWMARLLRWGWRPRLMALLLATLLGFCSWHILGTEPGVGVVQAADRPPAGTPSPDLIWINAPGLGAQAGLGASADLNPSHTPQLDALAQGGIAFCRTSERAWPSVAWPWPFSIVEPWLRRASHSDPQAEHLSQAQMAQRLHAAGFRCRALGNAALGQNAPIFEASNHGQRQRQRSLLLSHFLGRSLGALGFAAGPRAAPALETCFPFLLQDPLDADLAERVKRLDWPTNSQRDFLYINMDAVSSDAKTADAQLGEWLLPLAQQGFFEQTLLVITGWSEESGQASQGLPERVPLILLGPGLGPGKRVMEPISVRQLPAAVLRCLGLQSAPGEAQGPQSGQNQLYDLLQGG